MCDKMRISILLFISWQKYLKFKLISFDGGAASQAWNEANGLKASDLQSIYPLPSSHLLPPPAPHRQPQQIKSD